MIEMDQKEQILHYHRVDGLSLREISLKKQLIIRSRIIHMRIILCLCPQIINLYNDGSTFSIRKIS